MNYREIIEKAEEQILSQHAQLSSKSKGRVVFEDECDTRTCFQRDRDRILHSKSFRRLKDKTQVYLSPEGDHYRTRLNHTLEVTQIGRTIARALRLNEDLVEAICIGHDLGHTPFGHQGERALDRISLHGFKHYEQSLRVVDELENEEKGLNLTLEVRDGIVNHTGEHVASTLEGKIVKFADRIAYINHDIDDSVRAKLLSLDNLPKESIKVLGNTHSQRISTMVKAILEESYGKPEIGMNPEVFEAMMELRKFMFENVYDNAQPDREKQKVYFIIEELYNYFKQNPKLLPKELYEKIPSYDLDKVVSDYIAGMTDRYAIETFNKIFIPSIWKV